MPYNWQTPGWPEFHYDLSESEPGLLDFAGKAGQVTGLLSALPEASQTEAVIDVMIAEAVMTSQIEGEYVSRPDVRSSIRNQMGLNARPKAIRDEASQGVAELMVSVRETWRKPLDEGTLFAWHRMLLKGGGRGMVVGGWREHAEPMQVVSSGKRLKVHFEAPPSARVPGEMAAFIRWFNASRGGIRHAPVRSAVAHLHFESIHPFEDGNGRIGRAISEKALSQGLNRPALLSLSQAIEANKSAYYGALQRAQRSLDVTAWIRYFTGIAVKAQAAAGKHVEFVLRKARLLDSHRGRFNERQERAVLRMLEEGPGGFEGGMNASKYMAITKTSKATATRDLQGLAELGVLVPAGKGRSARYGLKL